MVRTATTQESEAGSVVARRATPADIPRLKGVLARAFDDDPFLNWFIRQDEKRNQRFERAMEVALTKMSNDLNETWTSEHLEGGALWRRPNEYKMSAIQSLAITPSFASVTGWSGLMRFINAMNEFEKKHEHYAPEEHYYLFVLGVEPDLQGKGIGGQLMKPVLDRADAEKRPCYLESSNPRNVPFYERHGFRVMEELIAHPTAPTVSCMRREPR
ncbi:MAG TPA: GNAT family N-acetyltransferase [Dehalococcoidia bacterium]|nr:GNAT family N-acetyltransferase [Dehalococcoidia bacterium]